MCAQILKERSLVKEKGEVLYEIIAFDESNCDSPRSEFSKHGQNLIVGGWFSKAAVDEILGMFAMDTAANNRTRRLAMTATPSSHPLRTVKDNNTMSSVSHMFVWGVTLALIARPWLTGDQPTIHWKLQIVQLMIAIVILFIAILCAFHVFSMFAVHVLSAEALERFHAQRGWLQRCSYQAAIITWATWWQKIW
ncbi:hypothetical protein PSV08DRAFT_406032 [Bipolaris maydis]|uniref:uncharacterized protein n=1 Tax=Cochliobolus heterostrophus TaxID=5016 RepID=UPI0024D5B6F3|nr:hypothetical protein J3E73DRAFT_422578 [Bipolaris maydis]KAJ6265599.1 hypothetical protein PSV08DRAFT_406032 [Bipolaris maydis]KAJ6283444.1 hypothetical protein J3E71DRAFT_398535 [Bipolaris maydis]